jgi:hypothetical protein
MRELLKEELKSVTGACKPRCEPVRCEPVKIRECGPTDGGVETGTVSVSSCRPKKSCHGEQPVPA